MDRSAMPCGNGSARRCAPRDLRDKVPTKCRRLYRFKPGPLSFHVPAILETFAEPARRGRTGARGMNEAADVFSGAHSNWRARIC